MMKKPTVRSTSSASLWIVGLFFISYYTLLIFYRHVTTDLQMHVGYARHFFKGGNPPVNPLYYGLMYLFSLISDRPELLLAADIVQVCAAVVLKFALTHHLLVLSCGREDKAIVVFDGHVFRMNGLILNMLSFALIVAFSLPYPANLHYLLSHYYLGQLPPNVWHNPSCITVAPLALLLFYQSYQYLTEPVPRRLNIIVLLILANVLIKPSFVYTFIVAFPVLLLVRYSLKRQFWTGLVPVACALLLIYVQYRLIQNYGLNSATGAHSGVKVALFAVWSHYSRCIPLSLLLSILFPLTLIVLYPSEIRDNLMLQYAWLLFLVGVLIFAIFAETGARTFHGNLSWQALLTNFILFVCTVIAFLKRMRFCQKIGARGWIVTTTFAMHVMSGLLYLASILAFKTYK